MIGWIIVVAVLVGGLAWLRFSIWKVKPEERGISVVGGVPRGVHGPGFCFLLKLPGSRLIRVPSKQFKVSISEIQVYSAEGLNCPRELLSVSTSFYLTFPNGPGLIDANQAGIPTKEEGLLVYFGPLIKEAVQRVVSSRTWRNAVNSIEEIRNEVYYAVTGFDTPLSEFLSWGGRFSLAVEGITLSNSLKAAISYVSQAQEASRATPDIVARRATDFSDAFLQAYARLTGWTILQLQEQIRQTPEMAKQIGDLLMNNARKEGILDGQLFDGQKITSIHVQGPERVLGGFSGGLRGSQQGQSKGKRRKETIGGVEEEVDD